MKYLKHHGILGQKWGVRRFQNPDGTLTNEGKRRYKYYGNSTKISKSTQEAINNAKNLVTSVDRIESRNKSKKDFSYLSDDEMRSLINRLNMEKQLSNLTEETKNGKELTMDILTIVGSIAAIGASGVTIYSELKKGMPK